MDVGTGCIWTNLLKGDGRGGEDCCSFAIKGHAMHI